MKSWKIDGKKITLAEGNIVLLDVDAVVNAANTELKLGGGVAGAIRRFGGESIQEECDLLGPIRVGEAVATGAGNLKARIVIHAVGPVYGEGDEDKKLKSATLNSLKIAEEKELRNMAFPAISSGIFGFPLRRCSEIMIPATLDFLRTHDRPEEVVFCLFGEEAYAVFEETLLRHLGSS